MLAKLWKICSPVVCDSWMCSLLFFNETKDERRVVVNDLEAANTQVALDDRNICLAQRLLESTDAGLVSVVAAALSLSKRRAGDTCL